MLFFVDPRSTLCRRLPICRRLISAPDLALSHVPVFALFFCTLLTLSILHSILASPFFLFVSFSFFSFSIPEAALYLSTMCFSAKHAINKSAVKRRNVSLPLNPSSPFLSRKKFIDLLLTPLWLTQKDYTLWRNHPPQPPKTPTNNPLDHPLPRKRSSKRWPKRSPPLRW